MAASAPLATGQHLLLARGPCAWESSRDVAAFHARPRRASFAGRHGRSQWRMCRAMAGESRPGGGEASKEASKEASREPETQQSSASDAMARARAYAEARKQQIRQPASGDPSPSFLPTASAATSAQGQDPRIQAGSPPEPSRSSSAPGSEAAQLVTSVPSIALMESQVDTERREKEMLSALLQVRAQREEGGGGGEEKAGWLTAGGAGKKKDTVEVEIVTREGVIKKQLSRSEFESFDENRFYSPASANKKKQGGASSAQGTSQARRTPALKVQASDFAGLNFSDSANSSRAVPAGLYAPADAPAPGKMPEVEIITRDAAATSASAPETGEAYKPKVATWGVFPRPKDISRTYGGGRNIRPGQALETEEEKKAREEKTRRLLEEYNKLVGLKLDPAVRAECEKALDAGLVLMDKGKLSDAIEQFRIVTSKATFKNDLHGKAAIQMAMCLDSLSRTEEARDLYERLAGHPNDGVKRKARQMLFGFQAAESLKLSNQSNWDVAWYRPYFDSLSKQSKYNNVYKAEGEEENATLGREALLYGALLLMPLALVGVLAASK